MRPLEKKARASRTGKPASGGKGAGKPASGGKGAGKTAYEDNTSLSRDEQAGHWLREATVIGLPELFSIFGHIATARELYEWWGQARAIVHKRVHGAPTRHDGRPGGGAMQRRAIGVGGGRLAGHWQP